MYYFVIRVAKRISHLVFCSISFLVLFFLVVSLSYNFILYADEKENAKGYLDAAAIFKESGDYDRSREILEQALLLGYDDKVLKYLARVNFLSSDSSEALNLFKKLEKQDWVSLFYLGLVYEDLNKNDLAIKSYKESIELKRNSVSLFRLGKIYREKKNYKEAVKFFSKAIEVDSSLRLVHYYIGECLYDQKKYDQAYKFLAKAANFYPKVNVIKLKLAKARSEVGKKFFISKKIAKQKERSSIKLKAYRHIKNSPLVRVGLGGSSSEFSFFCGGYFTASNSTDKFQGEANKPYRFLLIGENVEIFNEKNIRVKTLKSPLLLSSVDNSGEKYPFYLFDVVYGKSEFWNKKIDRAYRGNLEVTGSNSKIVLVNILSLDEYLYGVLPAEMPAKSSFEALKSQAVAARTFALRNIRRHIKYGFNFCSDVHCQSYQGMSAENQYTNKAVLDTKGEVLSYASDPIEIFYHSNCGGCLAADVFGYSKYSVSKFDSCEERFVDSPYQEETWFLETPNTFCSKERGDKLRWQRIYDQEDYSIVFNSNLEDLKDILLRDKGDCFHYKELDIYIGKEEKNLKGGLRIRNYFDKLKSSSFKLELKYSDSKNIQMLIFWGAGFGHGTGLCQEGAMGMASKGYSYKKILEHYYSKAGLTKYY